MVFSVEFQKNSLVKLVNCQMWYLNNPYTECSVTSELEDGSHPTYFQNISGVVEGTTDPINSTE